jgi:hypothetical protein
MPLTAKWLYRILVAYALLRGAAVDYRPALHERRVSYWLPTVTATRFELAFARYGPDAP